MNLNEIKNQHVHMWWGHIPSKIASIWIDSPFIYPLVGFGIGILTEAYQIIFKKEGWKIKDRLLDLFFWGLGSVLSIWL